MASPGMQEKLDMQPNDPICPKCGRVDIVGLTSEISRTTKEGAMIPDAPQLTWRCTACQYEWPR